MAWFRFYDEALDDPKVQSLPPELFKTWVNLLCLASRHEGKIPSVEICAFALRIDVDAAATVLSRLADGGLLDTRQGGANGSHHAIHGWEKRQYKSDSSTPRVKRFRKRFETVTETPPETETETETEKKDTEPKGSGASAPIDFEKLAFERGKQVLGNSAGGVIARLKREKCKTWEEALSVIEMAAGKASPMEWVQGVLRKPDPDEAIYRNVDYAPPTPEEAARWKAQGLS